MPPTRVASPVSVAAPGKLFVLGEYAVLCGGPALVTTVKRRVHLASRHDSEGYQIRGAKFDDVLHLPLTIRQVLRDEEDLDVDLNALTLDVSEFYEDGVKMGLGSSAASTVAVISAAAPHLPAWRRFELAWEIHHRFQGGVGSGADIAASTFGGTLAYHLRAPEPPFDSIKLRGIRFQDTVSTTRAIIAPNLVLPEGVRVDAVWTGAPASSVSFVQRLRAHLEEQPRSTEAILQSIAARARTDIKAVEQNDAQSFIDSVRRADRAMEQLGALTGLPIITDTHRRLRALGQTTGLVAKPSGAGGGDFTLLVGPRDSQILPSITDDFTVVPVASDANR